MSTKGPYNQAIITLLCLHLFAAILPPLNCMDDFWVIANEYKDIQFDAREGNNCKAIHPKKQNKRLINSYELIRSVLNEHRGRCLMPCVVCWDSICTVDFWLCVAFLIAVFSLAAGRFYSVSLSIRPWVTFTLGSNSKMKSQRRIFNLACDSFRFQ